MSSHKRQAISKRAVLRDPVCLLAFGFGTGLAPLAPGTFGTLPGLAIFLALSALNLTHAWTYGLLLMILFGIGIPLCASCERRLGVQDHSGIVWDEIVGVLITLWGVAPSWQNIVLGFLLFRLFDVLKPWPIRLLDRRVHGGLGIMLDDALAGFFGWGALLLLQPLL